MISYVYRLNCPDIMTEWANTARPLSDFLVALQMKCKAVPVRITLGGKLAEPEAVLSEPSPCRGLIYHSILSAVRRAMSLSLETC